MDSKKRRLQNEGNHVSENRGINKLIDDMSEMKSNVSELKKIAKMLLVQIKFQNNKITSLEEKVNQNSDNFEMTEIKEMIIQLGMGTESNNSNTIQEENKDYSYIA